MAVDRAITKAVSAAVEFIETRESEEQATVEHAFHMLGHFGRFAKSRLDSLTRIVVSDRFWRKWAMDTIAAIMADVTRDTDVAEDLDEWRNISAAMHRKLLEADIATNDQMVILTSRVISLEEELGMIESNDEEEDTDG